MELLPRARRAVIAALVGLVCMPAAGYAAAPPRFAGDFAAKAVSFTRDGEQVPASRSDDPWLWRFTPVTRATCQVAWSQMQLDLGSRAGVRKEYGACLKRSGKTYTAKYHEACRENDPAWTLTVTVTKTARRKKKTVVTHFTAVTTQKVDLGEDENGAPVSETRTTRWAGRPLRPGENFSSVSGTCTNVGF